MRTFVLAAVAVVTVAAAAFYVLVPGRAAYAQAAGYFDVSKVTIPDLKAPDWTPRAEGERLRYLCTNFERCPLPTAIDIKGVTRADQLPDAFETGALTPEKLIAQGKANQRAGSQFLKAEAITVSGIKGVHMEASGDAGGPVYFVTRWLGTGNRLLDVKVTARNLDQARQLADTATRAIIPQVFDKK